MMSRSPFIFAIVALLSATGLSGTVPGTQSAPAGAFLSDPGKSAGGGVIEIRARSRSERLYPPIAPSYLYYDYPYYYRRGHYPTHVGPGFIYYGRPYSPYVRNPYRRYGGRCSANWQRRCAREWADHRGLRRSKAQSFGACTCP